MNSDTIEIRRLRVESHIGVPDDERSSPQNLWISVVMTPSQNFTGLADNIAFTIDYYQVSLQIAEIAAARPRHLIETLAMDIVDFLLTNYPLCKAQVEVEKQVLSNADAVAVKIMRERLS